MTASPASPAPSGQPHGPRRHRPRPGAGFGPSPALLLLRGAIIAVSLAIGVVLLSRGDVVLGLLLVVFAGLRAVATVAMRNRRRRWRERGAMRRGWDRTV